MPLNLPDKLPAIELLKEENIFVIDTSRATQQDIRPLRIVILNLMPLKILKNSREHWEIENNLHWQLDVNFHEDNTRRRNISALNFSVLAKIAIRTMVLA